MSKDLKPVIEKLRGKLATIQDSLNSWKLEARRFKNKWLVAEGELLKNQIFMRVLVRVTSILIIVSIIQNVIMLWTFYAK